MTNNRHVDSIRFSHTLYKTLEKKGISCTIIVKTKKGGSYGGGDRRYCKGEATATGGLGSGGSALGTGGGAEVGGANAGGISTF